MPLAPASATPSESISGDDLQALVRCLWQELLQTNADLDNMTFYDAGGHSLLIVTLHQRLEERLTIRIPIAEFFAAPTITTMTNFLQELLRREKVVENGDIEEFLL
jgi:acyl carrier protein